MSLGDQHQVKHPHRTAVHQGSQLGRHLPREIRLACRERDHQVVDRPELGIDIGHRLAITGSSELPVTGIVSPELRLTRPMGHHPPWVTATLHRAAINVAV
jgi:hypothetical protein